MDTAGSVSKGCFAFKGKKKRIKAEDYLSEDKVGGASRRHERFIEMWEELDMEVQVLQADLNCKIFEDLLKFASDSHLSFNNTEARSKVVTKEIPTAALVTGVNTPDHAVMFGNMVAMLKDKITSLVATLKSKDCQNVKNILGKTLAQLLGNPGFEHDDDEEQEEINTKKLPLTLSTLAKWYKSKYMTGPSSPKKRKSWDGQATFLHKFPPIIIVFEDFESFQPKVVQDFVTIARYKPEAQDRDFLLKAAALDPRFKLLPFIEDVDRHIVYGMLELEASTLSTRNAQVKQEVQEQELPTDKVGLPQEIAVEPPLPSLSVEQENDELVEEPPKKKARSVLADIFDSDVYIVQEEPGGKSALEQAEDELVAYRKKLSVSFNDNPLDWWRANEIFFPLLAKLAKKYLSVPGTSVPSERVFSTAGDIVSGQRACLKAKHVDRLIFLKKNHNYFIEQLPLVFVFGIATSVSAVHRLLPNEVSSLLCMDKFQAPPSSEYLTLLINQVLMTPRFPFKLGGKVFQLLLDIFLYHDFSVLNFNKGLRFAMLDHYFNQTLSFLCCPKDEISDTVDTMNKNSVEKLRQLPSFMRYVENCSVQEQPDLLLNDKFTKGRIKTLLNGIHEYTEKFFPVLKCLHALVSKLPSYPLGKQLREVYSSSLENNIFDTDSYKQAMELLKMMSKDDLQQLITQCVIPIKDSHNDLTYIKSDLEQYLHRFNTLDEIVEEEEEKKESDEENRPNLPSKTSLHHLRQQLQDMSKRKKKLSPYEKLRLDLMNYLDGEFRKYMLCPKTLPLHEIFYYDSAASIRRHLNASPRSALQMALSNPHHYLQCGCCKSENNQVMSTMPDVCIIYRLHLECGQLINLYDWMQAFLTVIEADENEEESGKPSQELQARFIRAVSELQFLGFIKPTKRKTDHVARLTWGGC